MRQTPLTHKDIERILKRTYPRVHHVLHVNRAPQLGGISSATREQMHTYFQNKRLGVERIDLVAKKGSKNEFLIMQALYKRRALVDRIPRPLAYQKGTLLYRRLWGDELRRFPFGEQPEAFIRLCREVGELLAEIHNTPVPDGTAFCIRGERDRKKNLADVTRKFPEVMKRFGILIPQTPQKRMLRLIHGDFQASNLIITLPNGKIGVIDFAAGGHGDPATDIAGFLIHTELMLRGNLPDKKIRQGLDAFLRTYKGHVKTLGNDFSAALKAANFDVLLSILGATVARLPLSDKNYEPVVGYLYKRFHE